MTMERRGFTLMEMIVAFAIIAVLAGISYPVIRNGIAKSRQVACLSNLRNIGIAMETYLQDHNRKMPVLEPARSSKAVDVPVIELALQSYLPNAEVFHCPADYKVFNKTGSSYFWNTVMNGQSANHLSFMGNEGQPERIPLIADKEAWHPKPNSSSILYADLNATSEMKFSTSP